MNLIGTKELKTERLILRKLRLSDFEDLYEGGSYSGDKEAARENCIRGVNSYDNTAFHWVIEYQGHAVGRIMVWEVNVPDAYGQLGYDVSPQCRNTGIMTEALKAVSAYLLKEVQFNRLYAQVRESNIPSNRVLQNCGFVHEGVMRQHYAKAQSDGFENVNIWGLLQSDL